jgi:hypothetical protein
MRARLGMIALIGFATVVPHGAICARSSRLAGVLELGVLTEIAHLGLHALLFGLLATALSAWILRGATRPRAALALLFFVGVVMLRQGVQVLVRGARPGAEQIFELSLDSVAGALGAVGWALADPAGARRVARGLGWMFHPALIAPLGFFALCWSRTGSWPTAVRWTLFVALFEIPAICVWLWGLRRARFSDVDVSIRTERLPLLAFAALCALGLLGGTLALDAPRIVVSAAIGAMIGALAATFITRLGLKLSGHVGVAAGAAFALLPNAPRGALVFALVALMLVWARVRDERHKPLEVVAGFVLAALVAGVSIHSLG